MSTLDNLKKEAKRWLKSLRAGNVSARQRLDHICPDAPADPGLRDIQHALAREHDCQSWIELRDRIDARKVSSQEQIPPGRAETFFEFACWDHHTHGKADHRMHDRAAQRILAQHPGIARNSLYGAIVCGAVDEVRRILAEKPEAARERGGPRGWTPILYLAYTRFSHPPTLAHAEEIARLLLDNGANPNDFYKAGGSDYTVLVGIAGEGEQDSPRQPYAEALYRLLLERGAGPYDIQVLYNTHFSCDMVWWLDLTYQRARALGREADWADPDWNMLGMGGYGPGAFFVLNAAIARGRVDVAAWALDHGANPNLPVGYSHPKFHPKSSLLQTARAMGRLEIAGLLLRHGAVPTSVALEGEDGFVDAVMRLDRPAVDAILRDHPEYLASPRAMFEAARRDRPDAIQLLLDLGMPLEIADKTNARALHHAAAQNALRAAQFLIDRGAEIDPRETSWGGAPIGWAGHGDHPEMLALLARYSRNVWTLVFRGFADRLRDVLREQPELARQVSPGGITPLWWLPDDEPTAMAMVEMLLAAGADPSVRSRDGHTAADWAWKRGMSDIARRLAVDGAVPAWEPSPPVSRDYERFDRAAHDLLVAFETGDTEAMRRLMDHTGMELAWDQLRTAIRGELARLGRAPVDGDYFSLDHARLFIARHAGFTDWPALEQSFRKTG